MTDFHKLFLVNINKMIEKKTGPSFLLFYVIYGSLVYTDSKKTVSCLLPRLWASYHLCNFEVEIRDSKMRFLIILKVVTMKSTIKMQLNTHVFHNPTVLATVTTSCKSKEIQRKSCVVIQLCLSTHIKSLRDMRIG